MKTACHRLPLAVLLFVTLTALISAHAQITPSQDAYTDTSKPTINFGAATTLGVANTAPSIQFDLSSIPAGYTGANIAKATLKLYVNSATTAGSFNVDVVNGTWSEKTITNNLAPALGTTIVSGVPLTTASKNSYVVVDITAALQSWLNGAEANDGIALVAN
ncbi:MAG TPA: DNRLRE domain-containing protein, partial [Candidatus Sulfotelmatobacter sp.]